MPRKTYCHLVCELMLIFKKFENKPWLQVRKKIKFFFRNYSRTRMNNIRPVHEHLGVFCFFFFFPAV